MMRKFSAFANVSLAAVGSAAVVLGGQIAGVASVAPAAYQNAITTVVTINAVPRQRQSTCVDVHITVSSDAGQPTGSVDFSIDGAVLDTRTVPSSGSFTESINCGGAGTAARVLHGSTGDDAVQNVAFTVAAATSSSLSVGTHVLKAAYVPTGNWAPSQASRNIDIYAGAPTVVPGGSGFPTAVDAGLASISHAGVGSGFDLRAAISGMAMVLALGVVSLYRRRAAR